MNHSRLSLVALAAVALGATPGVARAEDYALLSLLGTQFTTAHHRAQTGSRVGGDAVNTIEVADAAIDEKTVISAEATLRKGDPGAGVARLAVGDRGWITKVRNAVDEGGSAFDDLVAPVVDAAGKAGARKLVLIVPSRADIRLQLSDGWMGTGRASGLGLYTDPEPRFTLAEGTREGARGALGLFANFKLVLVDIATKRTLRTATVATGFAFWAGRSDDGSVLDALTPQQKLDAFDRMIRRGIESELPRILSGI